MAKQHFNLAPYYQATNLAQSHKKGAIINQFYQSKNVYMDYFRTKERSAMGIGACCTVGKYSYSCLKKWSNTVYVIMHGVTFRGGCVRILSEEREW